MKAKATLSLTIDIDSEIEMGLEINNNQEAEEYAIEQMIEWIYEMVKMNDLEECIRVEIMEDK
jgi:hypothetical protein